MPDETTSECSDGLSDRPSSRLPPCHPAAKDKRERRGREPLIQVIPSGDVSGKAHFSKHFDSLTGACSPILVFLLPCRNAS